MFLENDFARPLFDFEKGGKPSAYQCLVKVDYKNKKLHNILGRDGQHQCGKITRTERGMRMHLKTVHNWEEQSCLYSTDHQTAQSSGSPRKLRAGPPRLESPSEKVPESTESTNTQPRKSVETNEGELLKLMREEK